MWNYILLTLTCFVCVRGEVFTAMADMESLVYTESELLRTLDNYIQAEEEKIRKLKTYMADYEQFYRDASIDVARFMGNPINAYLLVKKLTADWKQVESTMTQNVGEAFIQNITQYRGVLRFPTDEDLNGAAVALMRLQDTYNLDTQALARGELLGKRYSRELTAGDCFELGRQSYNNGDHYHTVLWMNEALARYENENSNNRTATRQDILEYLAFSTYMQGNPRLARDLTQELLRIVPTHQRALGNLQYYNDIIAENEPKNAKGDDGTLQDEGNHPWVLKRPDDILPERDYYERLCRGEDLLPKGVASRLVCRYTHNNVPFLFIQPVKEEEAYLSPRVLIYHDVILDSEIATIKSLAQPRFQRATVQNHKTGALETASYRISKSAWLKSEEHKHIATVVQRVGDVTGLDMDTAEELQVANYGLGGHYEPHFDFARKHEHRAFESLGTGNRIATFLFYKNEGSLGKHPNGNRIATWLNYMTDVEAGGATVFPSLGLSLWPKKGSAAFWYNLYPNGEGNELTRHAACPVLTGSKWVSNKWIHERGQEFRRPCNVDYYAEN